MKIKNVRPRWEVNYNRGYIGFTFHPRDFVSQGIAYFERWDRYSDIAVSHCFVVTGPAECIEAVAEGVVKSDLKKYFEDPKCLTFFRVPKFYGAGLADMICAAAWAHVGDSYGYGLIVADALANTVVGRVVNGMLFGWPHRWVSKVCDRKTDEICSELVALSLQSAPILNGRGCLSLPARMVTPQVLFEDEKVFEDWK